MVVVASLVKSVPMVPHSHAASQLWRFPTSLHAVRKSVQQNGISPSKSANPAMNPGLRAASAASSPYHTPPLLCCTEVDFRVLITIARHGGLYSGPFLCRLWCQCTVLDRSSQFQYALPELDSIFGAQVFESSTFSVEFSSCYCHSFKLTCSVDSPARVTAGKLSS